MHRPIRPLDAGVGLPLLLHPPAQPVMRLRVAPYAASVGCVGDRAPGYPESRSFGCCRRWIIEATRFLASFGAAGGEAPSCPGSSRCLLRLRHGSPVSLCPASSGFAGDGTPMRLEIHILRRCRLIVSGLPRTALLRYRRRPVSKFPWNLYLPAPADEFPELPRFLHPPVAPVAIFRVAPNLRSPGSANWPGSISPWRFGLSAVLMVCSPVRPGLHSFSGRFSFVESPRFHIHGWVDDEPCLFSNFASSACAADESSLPIRLRISCLALDAFSICPDYSLPASRPRTIEFNQSRIYCQAGLAVQLTTESPTEKRH